MNANGKHGVMTLGRLVVAAAAAMAIGQAAPALAQAQPPSAQGGAGTSHDMKGMGGMGDMRSVGGHDMKDGGMQMGGMQMGSMGGHDGRGSEMGGMMRKMLCGFADHLEGRLAYLKAELKLADAQQAAWTAFVDAYRAVAQQALQKCAAMDSSASHQTGSSAPAAHGVMARLEMMDRHMSDHIEIVRALEAALGPLYAKLTDDQKKIADQAMEGVMGLGMGGMGH